MTSIEQADLEGRADRPHGMKDVEIKRLCQLVRDFDCRRILEIGMANASSTVMLLRALEAAGGGEVVSIDPFQNRDVPGVDTAYNIRGAGMRNIEAAGLSHMHRLIEDYDYIAMPQLVRDGEKFDLVFIDGYHSFDYTFLDFFYADLLLKDGGVCAFHDTGYPAVHKVLQFLLRNKPYRLIGPTPLVYTPDLPSRLVRRTATILAGRAGEARERRVNWHSLAALQKRETAICPQLTLVDF
jgi:predicted O-methyltransferase YrrM